MRYTNLLRTLMHFPIFYCKNGFPMCCRSCKKRSGKRTIKERENVEIETENNDSIFILFHDGGIMFMCCELIRFESNIL